MTPEKPSDPQRQFLETGKGRLAYTDEGSGQHTVLAVPGLPGSVRDFRWLAPELSAHVRLVRLDLPGFGGSTREGYRGMTIAERAEPVLTLIQHLNLSSVTLIGHSSGGCVVAHIARHHPDLVPSCALIAAAGPTPHYPLRAYRLVASILRRRRGRWALHGLQRRLYNKVGFSRHLTDAERTYTTLDMTSTDYPTHRSNVANVRQPMLVAWAEDDALIPVATFEGLERLAPPGPRLRFTDGGHNIQKTKAVELAQAVLELVEVPETSSP